MSEGKYCPWGDWGTVLQSIVCCITLTRPTCGLCVAVVRDELMELITALTL